MIRINLLAERKAGKRPQVAGVPAVAGEGFQPHYIIFILIVVAALATIGTRYWMLTSEIARLQELQREKQKERDRLAEIIRKAKEFEAQRDLLKQKIQVINDLKKRQRAPVILLDQLSRNLPDNVWFESFTENNSDITIDGWAINANKIADFMDNLINSGYFINVEIPTWQEVSGRVKFKLTATFRIPEGES